MCQGAQVDLGQTVKGLTQRARVQVVPPGDTPRSRVGSRDPTARVHRDEPVTNVVHGLDQAGDASATFGFGRELRGPQAEGPGDQHKTQGQRPYGRGRHLVLGLWEFVVQE